MTEQAALRSAIIADPDDDPARLAYADWLDENNRSVPSPAAGASARAEFIRVQSRLAAGARSPTRIIQNCWNARLTSRPG